MRVHIAAIGNVDLLLFPASRVDSGTLLADVVVDIHPGGDSLVLHDHLGDLQQIQAPLALQLVDPFRELLPYSVS